MTSQRLTTAEPLGAPYLDGSVPQCATASGGAEASRHASVEAIREFAYRILSNGQPFKWVANSLCAFGAEAVDSKSASHVAPTRGKQTTDSGKICGSRWVALGLTPSIHSALTEPLTM
jgi:hypothetical protein